MVEVKAMLSLQGTPVNPNYRVDYASLVSRKKRGTKLTFWLQGALSVEEAHALVRWELIGKNTVIEFRGENTFCSLVNFN